MAQGNMVLVETVEDLCPAQWPLYLSGLLALGFLDRSWSEVVLENLEAAPHMNSPAQLHRVAGLAEAPCRQKGQRWQDALHNSDHLGYYEPPLLAAHIVPSH